MHHKGAQYTVKTGEEAIGLVKQCRRILDENTYDIKKPLGLQEVSMDLKAMCRPGQ